MMNAEKRVLVERHDRVFRILHWLIVAEMVILFITGLSVSERVADIPLLSIGVGRAIHVVTSLAWLGTITFFLYYFIHSGEYRWFGLRRVAWAIDSLLEEIVMLLRGERVKEPIRYNPRRGEYVEKIYPTEVLAWWLWAIVWTIMATTGLSLLFPETFGVISRFWHAIAPGFARAAQASRATHFVTTLVIVGIVVIHSALVVITGIWRSVITGKRDEPVAEVPALETR